jgi:16S rRNA A1518/A1519 N6-dimethyltransferase RsmA/KsgA/DIM1 with predicted DNA glycosylase/AP lyase activity
MRQKINQQSTQSAKLKFNYFINQVFEHRRAKLSDDMIQLFDRVLYYYVKEEIDKCGSSYECLHMSNHKFILLNNFIDGLIMREPRGT